MRYLIGLVFICFAGISAAHAQTLTAQSPSAAPVRDSAAVTALTQAVAAMGGANAISAIQNARSQGTITPAPGSTTMAGGFIWVNDFSGGGYEFRNEFQANGKTKVFASGHGNPAFSNGNRVRKFFSHVSYAEPPYHLPAIMLARELADPNSSIQMKGTAIVNGRPAIHIQTSVNTGPIETVLSPQNWYLDAATGIPLRVEYRTPNTLDLMDYHLAAADFSNYKIVNGIAVPFTITAWEDGAVVSVATITGFAFNPGTVSTDFDLVAGGGL